MQTLLAVDNVSFRYEDSAWSLAGVTVSVRAGEVLAVIGPNGSGKSTALKLAAGVLAPQAGRVLLAGRDMATLDRREVARTLGYLPQHVQYAFDYTAEEVVGMGRFPHLNGMGFLSAADRRAVDSALNQTETFALRARPLSHLSGGERQRVFLASVLAQEPRVLLLDEPTSALDIHHQARFFRLLRDLARAGTGVAVVTHDLNVASLYCDRLALLSGGCLACEGPAEEVLRRETLVAAYGEQVVIQRDALRGRPIVLPGALEEDLAGGRP